MYKIVDYGNYCAISTWTKVSGKIITTAKTMEEAKIKLDIYEQEKRVSAVCDS
jgi:hypothetical protein